MRSALLRGREHRELGRVAALAEARVGLALSRGGARKTYPHKDPNEDAAGFAWGAGGHLVLVADAHGGHEASEIAVEWLLERYGPVWTAAAPVAAGWAEHAAAAVADAHRAILEGVSRKGGLSRTTLALALLRPREERLCWASIGDSHIFCIGGAGPAELGAGADRATDFPGAPQRSPAEIAERVRAGAAPTAGLRALLLATDGLSERGIGVADPGAAAAAAARAAAAGPEALRPLAAARSLAEAALEAQRSQNAGDNVATAAVL